MSEQGRHRRERLESGPRFRVGDGDDSARVFGQRVLVVDDEPSLREALLLTLGVDHEVLTAASADEAIEIVRADDDFDVVLLDLQLGDRDGLELYELLRVVAPRLRGRCVLMTAAQHEGASAVRRFPELRLLSKPFFYDELVSVVAA